MRVLVVLTALALAAVASIPPHQLGREARLHRSRDVRARNATFVTCVTCETVMVALKAYLNVTSLGTLQQTLEKACYRLGNGTARAACHVLAAKLADALKELPDTLSTGGVYPVRVVCGLAGLCQLPCCESPTAPEQVYVTFGASPLSMRATWITLNNTASLVQWSVSPAHFARPSAAPHRPPSHTSLHSSSGNTTTYTRGGWLGTIHHAIMVPLKPRTRYYYRVGDGVNWSAVNSFRMPDLGAYPIRVAMVADMGYGENGNATMVALSALLDSDTPFDWLLLGGDNGYADGNDVLDDVYGRQLSPLIARVPYVTVPGNHEIFANFTPYRYRFPMAHEPLLGAMYWAFDCAAVRFIGLNGEGRNNEPFVDDVQLEWARTELEDAFARKQAGDLDWIIVTIHRPLYCSSASRIDCDERAQYLRTKFENLFFNNSVDIVFQGHAHNYERCTPVYRDVVMGANEAPVYVVNGFAGSREGDLLGGFAPGVPWRVVGKTGTNTTTLFGYGVLSASADQLRFDVFSDGVDGGVVDSFTIANANRKRKAKPSY